MLWWLCWDVERARIQSWAQMSHCLPTSWHSLPLSATQLTRWLDLINCIHFGFLLLGCWLVTMRCNMCDVCGYDEWLCDYEWQWSRVWLVSRYSSVSSPHCHHPDHRWSPPPPQPIRAQPPESRPMRGQVACWGEASCDPDVRRWQEAATAPFCHQPLNWIKFFSNAAPTPEPIRGLFFRYCIFNSTKFLVTLW